MNIDNADPTNQPNTALQAEQITEQIVQVATQPPKIDNDDQTDIIQTQFTVSPLFRCLSWIINKIPCLHNCLKTASEGTIPFYKRYSKQLYGMVSITLTIIVIMNYQSFKIHCPYDNQQTCLKKFIFPQLRDWLIKIIINCFFAMIQVHFLVYRVTYRFISIGGVLQIMYLYFLSDQTISPTYYIGAINFIHITFLALLLTVYFLVIGLVFLYRKNKYIVLIIFGLFLLSALLIYIFVLADSCDYWQKGINGKIEHIDGVCGIKTPPFCWYKILDGYFGLNWLFNNCFLSAQGKANFNQYFQNARSEGSFIAFPNPSKFTQLQRRDSSMQKSVMKYAKGFKTFKNAKQSQEKPDIIFDSQNQKYYIEIQRNDTLVGQRSKIWEQSQKSDSPPLAKNIIFLYVDAISRQSVHLKLPKLAKWFKQKAVRRSYDNNTKIPPTNDQEAYQFYRYNSLQAWTQPNEITMFYGVREDQYIKNPQDKDYLLPSVVSYYKKRGYITGSANSMCQTISANFDVNQTDFCESTRFDHESQSFACDPNFQDPQNFYSNSQGPYSGGKRCLYGKIVADYATEYLQSFFQTYNDQPKFFSIQLLEGHQGTGQGVKALNKPLGNLLQRLQNRGLLEDTMVMLLSDHGLHMQGLLFALGVQNFKTQKNLPVLMVNLPPKMNKKYRETIRFNQQYVVTSKNIYHYLMHLALGDKYEHKNKSLLSDLTQNNSCSIAGIQDDKFCSCLDRS